MGLDEKAAGAGGGVVDLVACFRFGELHQQAHHFRRRVELAALLAGAVGEVFDEVLVGCAQQVGELEVVVDQDEAGLVEVVQQVLPLLVRNLGLSLDGVEVDVAFEHSAQEVVLVFHRGNGLVEHVADIVLEVLEGRDLLAVLVRPCLVPAGADGYEEGLTVGGFVFQQFRQQFGLIGP